MNRNKNLEILGLESTSAALFKFDHKAPGTLTAKLYHFDESGRAWTEYENKHQGEIFGVVAADVGAIFKKLMSMPTKEVKP